MDLSSLLVILDQADGQLIIWHVETGPNRSLSRLSGAWVLDNSRITDIRSLVHDRPAVQCRSTIVLPQGITSSALVDLDATVQSVRTEIATADKKFVEYQATVKNSLVQPDWPTAHHPASTSGTVEATTELVTPALVLACGIAELSDTWAAFEALRLSRAYLISLGGHAARPLPLKEVR
ncbi:hypothetical protein ACQPZ2_01030 [Nocardia pseudovaccinii]|uniref:hypothetical protein n=1 Tax=Nocardia pseudovaccinii TaxID=189540 RepID=UPI003D8CF86C